MRNKFWKQSPTVGTLLLALLINPFVPLVNNTFAKEINVRMTKQRSDKTKIIAANVPSNQALIGQAAPKFSLQDTNGGNKSLSDALGKTVVLEWINFDCPFVRKHYDSGNMQKLQKAYTAKGVIWYSICSSAAGRQGNYPIDKIKDLLKQNNASPTAYLFDPEGNVGKSYGATATPHMFIINPKGILVYAGAIDDNPSADISDKAAVNYVQKALDEILANKPVSLSTSQAYGCSVKYQH